MIKTRYIGSRNNAEWQEECEILRAIERVGEERLPKFRVVGQPVETLTEIKVATDLLAMPPYDSPGRTMLRENLGADMVLTSEPRVWVRFVRNKRLSYSKQAVLLFLLGALLISLWATGSGAVAIDFLASVLVDQKEL